jgi:hypothetical protein
MKIHLDNVDIAFEHLKKFGDSDIFPIPFEYQIMNDECLKWISNQDAKKWIPAEAVKCLTAKALKGFRVATQLNPIDTVFYTALIVQEGDNLEKIRIPAKDKIVFSHRLKIDENSYKLFDPDYNYMTFIKQSLSLADKYNYVLKVDIADFFPRIYLHDIERAILDGADQNCERAISNFLKKLNTLETVDVLPIGTNASRYISNIVLNDLDHSLVAKDVEFCRFMDDFTIFGNSKEELYKKMFIITEILCRYHLNLQHGKTEIFTSDTYKKYCESISEGIMKDVSKETKDHLSMELFGSQYEEILYDDLDERTQTEIDQLHLDKMLIGELAKTNINFSQIRRILGFSKRIKSINLIEIVSDNLDKLFPVIDSVMKYLQGIVSLLDKNEIEKIKTLLMDMLLKSPHLSYIPFYKIWILNTLCLYKSCINKKDKGEIIKFYDDQDALTKRYIILLLGELKCKFWFRENKSKFLNLTDWQKAAFVKGFADCGFANSEKKPFLKTIEDNFPSRNKYILTLLQ